MITALLPCRPPLYYFLRLLLAITFYPIYLCLPFDLVKLVMTMCHALLSAYFVAQWDTTPAPYVYVPKRLCKLPDLLTTRHQLLLLLFPVSTFLLQHAAQPFSFLKPLRLRGKHRSPTRLHTTNRFTFRLRSGRRPLHSAPRKVHSFPSTRLPSLISFTAAMSNFDEFDHSDAIFDSDSFPIAVDNCASYMMTNDAQRLCRQTNPHEPQHYGYWTHERTEEGDGTMEDTV